MSELERDPLFVGLTRPPMIFGVSMPFALLNGMLCISIFIYNSDVRVLFLAVILHLIGFILCFNEPRFIELNIMNMQKCSLCKNRTYYGANSYFV
ncbi:MAG: VirB3 family type IV secretion system protein [Rickettsiaceae bacterium]|nr:VirB3 family type IV secretion system protein [Rickettsiaceae bacterium]